MKYQTHFESSVLPKVARRRSDISGAGRNEKDNVGPHAVGLYGRLTS